MEVKVYLSDMKFRYEVYQLFNVYFPMHDIQFVNEDEADYIFCIDENTGKLNFKHKEYFKDGILEEELKQSLRRFLFLCLKDITGEIHPWGTLIGIRPSKIALKLLNEGNSEEEVIEIFKNKYYAHEDKARLCIDVAKAEERIVNRAK